MDSDQDNDAQQSEDNLGMAHTESSGYLTGNDDNSPDTRAALEDVGAPSIVDIAETEGQQPDEGLPGAGDSRVGLGGATGTEHFGSDLTEGNVYNPQVLKRIGNEDFHSQEAMYEQYMEHSRHEVEEPKE